MPHPLIDQLRFARSEFRRGIAGVTDEEARRCIGPMNCISWNVGHLAWQEQRYWLQRAQDKLLLPDIAESFKSSGPPSTPPLDDVIKAWDTITGASDPWLDAVTPETLQLPIGDGPLASITYGNLLLRTTYHYWFHTGENAAIRQSLGHTGLPDFVGDIDEAAPYRQHPM